MPLLRLSFPQPMPRPSEARHGLHFLRTSAYSKIHPHTTMRRQTSVDQKPLHHDKDRTRIAPVSLAPTQPGAAPAPRMVEVNGIEPMTSCLQSRRSPN